MLLSRQRGPARAAAARGAPRSGAGWKGRSGKQICAYKHFFIAIPPHPFFDGFIASPVSDAAASLFPCFQVNTQDPRVSIAIVGLSFGRGIAEQLLQSPASSRFVLKGVCDLRQEVAEACARDFGVAVYRSLEELLGDPGVEAIGLFTRPHDRGTLMRQILAAGKHIVTTKPFELDSSEAASALERARHSGRIIHLNSPGPELTPDMEQIERWRSEFELGRLVSARGEVWASYFENADGSWMDDPYHCPAGPMMRLGIYLINDIVRIAGPILSAHVQTSHIRTGRPTPDNAMLAFTCESGCLASVYASFCVEDGDRYSNGLTLNFERGSIYRNIGKERHPPGEGKVHLSLIVQGRNGHRRVADERVFDDCLGVYQWDAFYKAIRERQPMAADYGSCILEGVRLLETLRTAGSVPA